MFRNYIRTALRYCRRNKAATLVHVLSLATGISAALVIFLIVQYEYSFDRFEKDKDRIYRVVLDLQLPDKTDHNAAIPAPLVAALQREVTGVEQVVPVFQYPGSTMAKVTIVQQEPVVYKKQPDIVFTNQSYFPLLSCKWLAGSAATALQQPFTAVLTAGRARLYFPHQPFSSIIGRQLRYDEQLTVTVTGIVDDLHQHTGFTGKEFIAFSTIAASELKDQFMLDSWNDWMAYSQLFVKLSAGVQPAATEAQLQQLHAKYGRPTAGNAGPVLHFRLQPLGDVHFNTHYQGFLQRVAHKPTLYGLMAIAVFLLLLGCINFINLTTAQAAQRAKEVGIRKTMGGTQPRLILQFLAETFFTTLVSAIVSLALVPVLLQAFAGFIPPELSTAPLLSPSLLLFMLALVIVVSVLAGLYPAFILAGYKPVLVLKNQAWSHSGQTRSAVARKTLTITQFVVAQFFIIATVVAARQIHYSLHKDLGYRTNAILNFDTPHGDTVTAHGKQLLALIRRLPGVETASQGFLTPADMGAAFTRISYFNGKETVQPQGVQIRWGDSNYLKVYQIRLLAGRNITSSDTIKELLINATFARTLGFRQPADALGKQLSWNNKLMPIVGVIQDFHDQSLRSAIAPLVFGSRTGSTFHIQLAGQGTAGWQKTIEQIGRAYREVYPEEDFSYTFFDDTIAGFYTAEQNTSLLLQWATGLTVFISCLGLLGLVLYTTRSRTKEIGIRKLLGASSLHIAAMLCSGFVRLVSVAFVIAVPLAWWAAYEWLQQYAYRVTVSWWIFAVSGVTMLLFAFITLSIQTIRTAWASPVKNLRTE
jgi:ABC-type antimicrobial peptide transport system permease subunit